MYNLGDEYCESQNLVMNLVPNLVMTFLIYTKLSLLTSKYFPKN